MGMVPEVADSEFKETVLNSKTPVLVDFWAEWCGPCKIVSPVVEELAQEYGESVKFFKMDVDANSNVPSEYRIRSIPTLLVFKDGKPVGQIVGAQPKETIKARVDEAIA